MDRCRVLKVQTLALLIAVSSFGTPKVDIEATDYIAIWKCKDGKMVRVWTAKDLEDEEIEDIKLYDKKLAEVKCKEVPDDDDY